jgi:cytochrome o ubiquinol oxidase operon protein cyoD
MNETDIDSTGAGLGSFRSYGTGFILAVILTVVAFGAVMSGAFSRLALWFVIFGAAILQILVHLHYFLHLDDSSAMRWNVLALVFTVLILVLFIGGTLWIMSNMDYRMM